MNARGMYGRPGDSPVRATGGRLGAAALGLALLAGGVQAAPFQVAAGGPDNVWVLDENSGALTWCQLAAPPGPKVIDVFGFESEARAAKPRSAEPVCTTALGPQVVGERVVRSRSISWWSGYTQHLWGGWTTRPFKTTVSIATGGPRIIGPYSD